MTKLSNVNSARSTTNTGCCQQHSARIPRRTRLAHDDTLGGLLDGVGPTSYELSISALLYSFVR